jgi:uncharacterized integral membrane protein
MVFWVVGVPVAIVAVALSVANRAPVTFSFDPVSSGEPAWAVTLPLFLLLFASGFIGLLIGWFAGWAGQRRHRREERRLKREVDTLKARQPGADRPAPGEDGGSRALTRAA